MLEPRFEITDGTEKKKILFVCTGNTCRSPMAEALFRHLYADSVYEPFSRGLAADSSPISENAVTVLMERGVLPSPKGDYRSHLSQTVRYEDLESAELVVGISSSHAMSLMMKFPAYASKICVMPEDIPDPYGGSLEVYRLCLEKIEAGLKEAFGKESQSSE